MLSIPNYYRGDADQNNNKKSNPIWQNGHPNSLQTVHGEESQEMTETPLMFPGNKHWQQPLEGTACTGQNKRVKRTKPKILIPTPGPILQKTIIQNDTHTPTFTEALLTKAETNTWPKCPLTGQSCKETCGTSRHVEPCSPFCSKFYSKRI